MKKILTLALVMSAVSLSSFAASVESSQESYSNFPTISSEFKTSALCESWLAEKTAKYGDRVISSASGCAGVRERVLTSGSSHAPSFRTQIVGTVILDTL